MNRMLLCTATLFGACGLGCAPMDSDARLREAMDLVEERLGVRPDWLTEGAEPPAAVERGGVLPLDSAISAALRNSPELRANLAMIGVADAELLQAGLMANPMISFMVMFPSGGGRTMLRAGGLPIQPLQDLWLIPARREVAAAELQRAVVAAADRAVQVASQVRKTYAELQHDERSIELIRTNMALVEQSIQVIETQQTAGSASQNEVNLARIRLERLRSELLATEARLATRRHELLMLMGLATADIHWHAEPLEETTADIAAPPMETDVVVLAAQQRLDLKAAEWSTEAAAGRISLARREGWPDLAVGFTFERAPRGRTRGASGRALAADAAARGFVQGISGAEEMPSPPQFAPLPRPTRDVTYALGPMIELELPIFDWGQAQSARAYHEYRQRLAEHDALLQETVKTVRQTIALMNGTYRQVALFRDVILPDVGRNLELSEQSYVAGQTDLTIYLQAQEDAISTRLKLLELMRDYRVQQAELERVAGGSLNPANTHEQDVPSTKPAEGPRRDAARAEEDER